MSDKKRPEVSCFGQVLCTLYYHLQHSLNDFGKVYEVTSLVINEDEKSGEAILKCKDGNVVKWIFDSVTEIWVEIENFI